MQLRCASQVSLSACGFMPQRRPAPIAFRDGDLGWSMPRAAPAATSMARKDRERWHAMLIQIANERDYKPGWVAHKYKEKFGGFPAWGASPKPLEPTPEVRSWVRSRQIAFAKGRVA